MRGKGTKAGVLSTDAPIVCVRPLRAKRASWSSVNPNTVLTALFGAVLVLLTGARLMMSLTLHMWYAWVQGADDYLLMHQALKGYASSDDSMTLAKNPGYGYWIRLFSKLGLTADLAQFLIWFAASLIVALAFQKLFGKPVLTAIVYVYVLWNPIAFENWLGTRFYRNSLFAPLTFLLVGLLILFIDMVIPIRSRNGKESDAPQHASSRVQSEKVTWAQLFRFVLVAVGVGASACLMYLLREDSVWLLPMLLFVLIVKIVIVIRANLQIATTCIILLFSLLPALTLIAGIAVSMKVNQHYFGVALLNTRTQGELAGFVNRTYEVDNAEQNPDIWAPPSSIQQVIDVSPTLQHEPELIEQLYHAHFASPDIKQHPLRGDFLTWQIRLSVQSSGGWQNEAAVQRLFHRINTEIDQAYQDGRLRKSDKFFLSSSLVPRTQQQIIGLSGQTARSFWWNFDCSSQYRPTTGKNDIATDPKNIEGLHKMDVDPANPNPVHFGFFTVNNAQNLSMHIVTIYSVVNKILAFIFITSIALSLFVRTRMRQQSEGPIIILGILLLMYALFYGFSVAWFTEYVHDAYVTFFYTVGTTSPFVSIGLLLALGAMQLNLAALRDARVTPEDVVSQDDSPLRTLG